MTSLFSRHLLWAFFSAICALVLVGCGQFGLPASPDPSLSALNNTISPTLGGTTVVQRPLSCPTTWASPYNAEHLEVGIYWYSGEYEYARGGVGCKARANGGAIRGYHDPQKPTIIFVHGWQYGYVPQGFDLAGNVGRAHFWAAPTQMNVVQRWKDDGWNVGIFHWTQLADEEVSNFVPYNAQAKIWTAHYVMRPVLGRRDHIGMRYRTPYGYSRRQQPKQNVSELFYAAYRSALQQWQPSSEPVRLVGHSLGAQVVLGMAEQAYQDPTLPVAKRPVRLVLGDPFWSAKTPAVGHHYDFLWPEKTPAERSRRIIAELISAGAVVEWIRSSPILDFVGDPNTELLGLISRAQLRPDFVGPQLSWQHMHGWQWYFAKKGQDTLFVGPNNTTEQARALMLLRQDVIQRFGQRTADYGDDSF